MTPVVVALKVIASPRKSTAWEGLLPCIKDVGVGVAAISLASSSDTKTKYFNKNNKSTYDMNNIYLFIGKYLLKKK